LPCALATFAPLNKAKQTLNRFAVNLSIALQKHDFLGFQGLNFDYSGR
jgi:hypothetical protein